MIAVVEFVGEFKGAELVGMRDVGIFFEIERVSVRRVFKRGEDLGEIFGGGWHGFILTGD